MIEHLNNNMKMQKMWPGFSGDQYTYIKDIIKHSDARSVCELGTFVGTTATEIWKAIKDDGKSLYLVDNYFFIPEHKREKFFSAVKFSIDPNTKNIHTILESSHTYDWTKHDFIFFGHHDAEHMLPDLHKLLNSDVNYAIIGDGTPTCFQRTKAVYELLSNFSGKGLRPQYYLNGLIVMGRKKLTCTLETHEDFLFGTKIKYMPKSNGNYLKKLNELTKLY